MTNSFMLLGDASRLLACRPYQIVYLISSGQVPEPALRIGNRRIFQADDIRRLAERLNVGLLAELSK